MTTLLSQRYVVLSLDALGDLTLRQPLLSGLLDKRASVCVVTRPHCTELVPIIDQRLTHIETTLNPYRLSSVDAVMVELKKLLSAIQAWEPTAIICPLFNRTFIDEWLLRNLPGVKRFGFFPGNNQQSELDANFPALVHDLPLSHGDMFTGCVSVEKDLHECDKFQELFNKLVGEGNILPDPVLNLHQPVDRNNSALLDSMTLEAGQYAIVSSAATSSTLLKAITDDQAIALIKRLYFKHGIKSVLIGTPPERSDLKRVADKANAAGATSTVWVGQPGSLIELLSLISTARLYVGCDTGPMHFAAALGVPVLAIFGGGHFPRFLPRARHAQVLTQYLPCFSCDWDCPFDRSFCIEMVDTKAIEESLDTLLTNSPGNVLHRGCPSNADPTYFLQQFALPVMQKFNRLKAEREHFASQLQLSEADRAARGEQIETLTKMVKELEADRAARGEQMETLTKMVKESEADRAARGEQIEALTKMVKESEADRAARGEQIEALTKMVKESEADRAARGEQIETLTKMVKESEADRAARGEQIEAQGEQIELLKADLRALFARPGFRLLTKYSNWLEVKKLAKQIGLPNE
jgi:hypothetical protein